MPQTSPPLVLCLSGHDPTGGAGVHADIEAVGAQGAHALTLVSALTVQDCHDVQRVVPVPAATLAEQFELLAASTRIAAIKIGLLGAVEQVALLARWIERLRVPVVLDPVLRAGGGSELASAELQGAVLEQLLPRVTVLTPNRAEARRLAPGQANPEACAAALLARGCAHLLVTGGDEPGAEVVNTWYRTNAAPVAFRWPRLPETFHGAGCTLAAALAARLASGEAMAPALDAAQRWTQAALAHARTIGEGRRIPGRILR